MKRLFGKKFLYEVSDEELERLERWAESPLPGDSIFSTRRLGSITSGPSMFDLFTDPGLGSTVTKPPLSTVIDEFMIEVESGRISMAELLRIYSRKLMARGFKQEEAINLLKEKAKEVL